MRFYVVLFSVQNKQNSRSLECHNTEHRSVGRSRWVYHSAWTSDPSLTGPDPFDKRRVSRSFCGGSLVDVSVTALSEVFKRRKAKSNVPLRSPMCVVCRSVSHLLRERRWLRGTKHVDRGAANGLFRVKRVSGCLHHIEKIGAWGMVRRLEVVF